MTRFAQLFRYVLPYWKQLSISAIALTITSLIGLVLPSVIRQLVDTVFLTKDFSQLNYIGLGLVALFIIQALFSFVMSYLLAYVGQRVITDLREVLQSHLLLLPLRFYNERRVGEIVSRLTNDVAVVQTALTDLPINLLSNIVTLAGGLVLMVLLNWQLTLMVLVLVPVLTLIAIFFGRRLEKISTGVQDRLAEATAALEESLAGIRVVKSFSQERFEQIRYHDRLEETFQMGMKRVRLRSVFNPLVTFAGYSFLVLVVWYGGRQVVAGAITPGGLVAFLFYALLVTGPLSGLASLYSTIREAMGASKRLFEILEASPEPFTAPGAPPLPPVKGRVRFRMVTFSYDSGAPVLQDIDLDVPPSQVVALVGSSGVGKTTFVNLIPRFFDPSSGSIEVDGQNTQTVELGSLRQQIGLVPQDTFLFGGTVRANIAYGLENISQEDVVAAAQAAYAHEFISALPQGYDSIVGERGVKLSAGQRQRLAIARALLKNPRILILDEATSALDTESERFVQAALEKLMKDRTTFVIAHRLSTIQRADRILVLKEGRVVEDGTHEQLLAQNGLYHHLWELQFQEPEQ